MGGPDIPCFLCFFYFQQLEMFWKVTVRNVLESVYPSLGNKIEEIKKVCKSAFQKNPCFVFVGSSATAAAILKSDKSGKLSAAVPAGRGQAGNHCHSRGSVWHCRGHPD